MDRALGTTYEVSLRMLLLLEVSESNAMTADMLAAIDFITVYGRDFGITEENLHGNGTYRFGEFTLRRELVKEALKPLVVDGIVSIKPQRQGFMYSLSQVGIDYCSKFESDYADDYRMSAEMVINCLRGKSEREMTAMINQRSLSSVQRSQ